MIGFAKYRRTGIAEMRPYVQGESLTGVSISGPDREAGSPRPGDMIARNPANHADQWLVAKAYFEANFELVDATRERAGERPAAPMFGSPQDAAIFLARSLGRVAELYLANRDEFERRVERDRLSYREAHYQEQWDEAVRVLREYHANRTP